METQSKSLVIENLNYEYKLITNTRSVDAETTHIVIPMHENWRMTLIAVECIKKFTLQPYLIWIVDNFSSADTRKNLLKIDGVNLIFNNSKNDSFFHPWNFKLYYGSISNGVALELAAHTIENLPGKYMFGMHNDALPVKSGWLSFLKSKLNDKVKIAGVSQDKIRVHAVHQSGFLFDLELYQITEGFMPNMPEYDVGDGITLGLKRYGYVSFVCMNTFNNPETVKLLNRPDYPDFLRDYIRFDRCFNDNGDLIYLHLGRGTQKFRDLFSQEKRMSKKDWIRNIRTHFL